VFDTVIGVVFVFAVFAFAVSGITEGIARFLGLRAEFLLRGIASMLTSHAEFGRDWITGAIKAAEKAKEEAGKQGSADKKPVVSVATLMSEPVIDLTAALKLPPNLVALRAGETGSSKLGRSAKRDLPSYLSARTFSDALVRTLVPDPTRGTTTLDQVRASVEKLDDDGLKKVLLSQLDRAGASIDTFRKELETWYDDHMARVSGWYQRHTRWYLLAVGAVLAVGFNINAISMAQAFYSDQALL
jgi:hypothetical protein